MGRYNHSLSIGATIMCQKTAQPLVNMLLSFSCNNKLPLQQYGVLKTPLITALGACN